MVDENRASALGEVLNLLGEFFDLLGFFTTDIERVDVESVLSIWSLSSETIS
jgi:hypothetical protein